MIGTEGRKRWSPEDRARLADGASRNQPEEPGSYTAEEGRNRAASLIAENCHKRLLLVCGSFPPESDVGGVRPAMFAKYLPGFGWQTSVLTAQRPEDDPDYKPTLDVPGIPSGTSVFRVLHGQEHTQRALEGRTFSQRLRHFFLLEEAHPAGLCDKMLQVLPAYVSANQGYDAVYGTTPDLCSLRIARAAAQALRVPWVADFRNIIEETEGRHRGLRRRLFEERCKLRRRQLVRSAAAILTLSGRFAELLGRQLRRHVDVLPNGFDPEMFPKEDPKRTCQFRITYMGRILGTWFQDPRPFFAGLDMLLADPATDERDISINFYATDPQSLARLVSPYSCRHVVKAKERIRYSRVPQVLSRSSVLLLLTNRDRTGTMTTKVYEYLAARRPILLVPGEGGELEELVQETRSGVTHAKPEAIYRRLREWYHHWKTTGMVPYDGLEEEIKKYSRKAQAGELARILNGVVAKAEGHC